jgi:hypothetical protein
VKIHGQDSELISGVDAHHSRSSSQASYRTSASSKNDADSASNGAFDDDEAPETTEATRKYKKPEMKKHAARTTSQVCDL